MKGEGRVLTVIWLALVLNYNETGEDWWKGAALQVELIRRENSTNRTVRKVGDVVKIPGVTAEKNSQPAQWCCGGLSQMYQQYRQRSGSRRVPDAGQARGGRSAGKLAG